MLNKNIFLIIMYFLAVVGAGAQTRHSVKGKVLDSDGQPLSGSSVIVSGTQRGTTTDTNGYFSIDAGADEELQFSYIGFVTQTIKVGVQTSVEIVMKEDASLLGEVVVVGMGTQRKVSVVGAISNISMNDLKIPVRSLTSALAGRMAGAVVVQRTGEIGNDDASFWIRGISTFSSNRNPLILVDGVERTMNDLSVEEVESISILKDASATAVYGTRAANGVVLISTRKGVVQKPSVEFKVEHGMSDLPGLPQFLAGPEYAMLYNEAFGKENYSQEFINKSRSGEDPYLYPNVNWYNEIYKKFSNNTNASVNVTGGGEVARYFVGFGYIGENGNLRDSPDNDYKSNLSLSRYNYRSNVDISLTKTTTVDLEVGGSLLDLQTPGVGYQSIYGSYFTPAQELFYWSSLAQPIANPVKVPIAKNEVTGADIMGWGAPTQVGEKNPAERLFGSGYNSEFRNQFMGQIALNQDLKDLIDGLKFKFSFSFDAYNQTIIKRQKNSPTYMVNGRNDETGELIVSQNDKGTEFLGYSRDVSTNRAKEMKVQLIYDRLFGASKDHRVGAMTMYYQRDYVNGAAASAILSLPYRRQGIALRATYSFQDKYFGEFNLGYNGSENFPKENRFGLFPAFACGYLISGESFWDGSIAEIINMLKIKGSMGLVGSEALPNGERYGYLSLYGGGLGGYVFGENAKWVSGTGENRVGVSDLTWEKGLKKNIGIEMNMFNNMITLEADFFHEQRTDILVQRQSLPDIAGFPASPFANIGEMVNRGVDATASVFQPFENGSVKVYGNFTFARDKIIFQDEAPKNYDYRMRTGHKYGQIFGLIDMGYFVNEDDIANSPLQTFGEVRPGDVKYRDINGDGQITVDDEVPIGYSSLPEINYGFGTQVEFHGFDLGLFFRGQARVNYTLGGAYIPFAEGVGKRNLFVQALDRWTVENPRQDAQYPRLYNGTSSNNWRTSTKTIYDGSFLRLADVELGYNFNPAWLKGFKAKWLRLYFICNNAAVFSNWDMWDPETGTSNGQNYPLQRKFNIGLRVRF
ncbi:MAG: TonB-dependent receptor [Tannerella sp.]|jgi:TonB-linked SusC/RagA family outer membrane protein|nr:TonB-dependent receptor [Tannerella sp.]